MKEYSRLLYEKMLRKKKDRSFWIRCNLIQRNGTEMATTLHVLTKAPMRFPVNISHIIRLFLIQHNTLPYSARLMQGKLKIFRWKMFDYPSYLPVFGAKRLPFFPMMKKEFRDQRLDSSNGNIVLWKKCTSLCAWNWKINFSIWKSLNHLKVSFFLSIKYYDTRSRFFRMS